MLEPPFTHVWETIPTSAGRFAARLQGAIDHMEHRRVDLLDGSWIILEQHLTGFVVDRGSMSANGEWAELAATYYKPTDKPSVVPSAMPGLADGQHNHLAVEPAPTGKHTVQTIIMGPVITWQISSRAEGIIRVEATCIITGLEAPFAELKAEIDRAISTQDWPSAPLLLRPLSAVDELKSIMEPSKALLDSLSYTVRMSEFPSKAVSDSLAWVEGLQKVVEPTRALQEIVNPVLGWKGLAEALDPKIVAPPMTALPLAVAIDRLPPLASFVMPLPPEVVEGSISSVAPQLNKAARQRRAPGRHRLPANDWAYQEYKKGRAPTDLVSEWLKRRTKRLPDGSDPFDVMMHAIIYRLRRENE